MSFSSASSAIFGPMIRPFTWFYDNWRANNKEKTEERRRAYKEHFEPAYLRLENIHKNYIQSFHNFYELCRKFETPPKELLYEFRNYGMEYTTWREDLRNFSQLSTALSKSFRRKEEKEAITNFNKAVIDYFNVTITSGEYHHWPSWFTAFINDFEQHVREGRSPWDHEYLAMGVNNPKETFIERLKAAYEVELPNKWNSVAVAKTNIQKVFNT